mmetsp:Transcript_26522/g.39494  ORF Transcript_26522/g.39494 Transcript_26522/m.39494 type:complete len:243 (+) Transcript_26522:107-835(+)
MISSVMIYLSALLLTCSSFGLGFSPSPLRSAALQSTVRRCIVNSNVRTQLHMSVEDEADILIDVQKSATISPPSASTLYPVISKIAGKEWTGSCRYVNANLEHATKLKLVGGVKYEISDDNKLTLSSFLTFPNGQTRQVVMEGARTAEESGAMTLNPVEDGPIIMKLSEVAPDTILINEVEKESGKIIMTSSISVVQTMRGTELVGASHEVGEVGKDAIEGHQLWRMMENIDQKVVLSREFE